MSDNNQDDEDTTVHLTPFPTTLADLSVHLPSTNSTARSIYSTLSALRKSTLSIPNRLTSILHDAEFVQALYIYLTTSSQQPWPLIPNERSGSWPLDPDLKQISQAAYLSTLLSSSLPVSAYFKSTDGHINQWSFSPRRLNLSVLSVLGHNGSAILVDTTRRGKSYPDALRRTVPIWCAVWNRVLFPEYVEALEYQALELDQSEVAQIEARIPRFVTELKSLGLDIEAIRNRVRRPMRCIWIAQPAERWEWEACFRDVAVQVDEQRKKADRDNNVLVCCSASKRVVGAEMSEEGYIQGAGDDSEGWSCGLTANVFWASKDDLIRAVEKGDDMDDFVRRIVVEAKGKGTGRGTVLIAPTSNLHLAACEQDDIEAGKFDLVIDCNKTAMDTKRRLILGCKEGKLGSKTLRDKLGVVKAKVAELFKGQSEARLLIVCSTGKDLSAGVALAILCCFFNDKGVVQPEPREVFDKQFIRQRLAWITSSKPDANPSRATLQAVNSFLMNRPE